MANALAAWMSRSRIILLIKFVIALGALLYVVYLVDWEQSIEVIRRADKRWLLSGFGLSLLGLYFAACRWCVLLRAAQSAYGIVQAYRAYLTGTFFGLVMPGVIGGDATRIWLCHRATGAGMPLVVATVLLERILGVVALLMLLSVGLTLYPSATRGLGVGFVPLLALVGLSGIVALPRVLNRLWVMQQTHRLRATNRLLGWVLNLSGKLAGLRTIRGRNLLLALLLSFLFQLLDIAATYLFAQALEIGLSTSMLLVAMPVVYLATVLPISPGGLGVREGALVLVLALFGIAASDAAILALVVFANRAAIGLLGGLQHVLLKKTAGPA